MQSNGGSAGGEGANGSGGGATTAARGGKADGGRNAKRARLERPGNATGVEHAPEAEASLLQLEVKELLSEVRADPGQEGPLLDFLERLEEHLLSLGAAEADPARVHGLLHDLGFALAVSSGERGGAQPAPR